MNLSTQSKQNIKNTVLCAAMGTVLFAVQVALSFLPNIEAVSVIIAVYAAVFGFWALPAVYVFVFLEGLLYGFNIWWVCYLYVWAVLFAVSYCMRRVENAVVWALMLAIYGLFFGALCALPIIVTGGVSAAVSWWISGIPFDIAHCAGNFAVGIVLFKPLKSAMLKIKGTVYKE